MRMVTLHAPISLLPLLTGNVLRIGLALFILGKVNFLCCFSPNLLDTAHPLSVMTSTKIPFIWGSSEENAFLEIKKIMVALPVLALPNSDKPFIVETNASDFAIKLFYFKWEMTI